MTSLLRGSWVALVIASGLLIAAPMVGQDKDKTRPVTVAPADVDAEQEAAALAFAKEHHPELAKLLGPMKAGHPREYQKALRELYRVSDRLTRMQTRQPERYAIELDLWKTESRLRLVAAKSAMVDDDERREQIEKLVADRNALKLRLFEFEKSEAEERITQLNRQIDALKSQQSDAVRKEVDRLVNTAKWSANRVKTKLQKPPEAVSPSEKPKSSSPKHAPGVGSAS